MLGGWLGSPSVTPIIALRPVFALQLLPNCELLIMFLFITDNAMENVKKCKNFLSTLIKLAGSQPAETIRNVKDLIQVRRVDDHVHAKFPRTD